ncbi:MAG: VCBS repeat-containing protein [Proteobacteria bacterium]|nr:VCBS repeat-containing protein [Pseudomonadota bacterium]
MRKEVFKISIMIFLLNLMLFISTTYAEKVKTIAVLPFKMYAAKDLTFLQEGIMDMLSSRLSLKDKLEVLEKRIVKKKVAEFKGSVNKETALKIGKALKADYVILGSLTVFGDSVSIDAKILDVNKEKELITAFNQSKGMDAVIPTVNQFAQDINAKILDRRLVPPQYVLAPSERTRRTGPSGLIKVKEDFYEREKKRVIRLNVGILGMDIGDVDGDGQNEMVCIDNRRLYIYKWRQGRFAEIKRIKGRWSPNYVWVDVADLNGNGRAEIYVSNLTHSGAGSLIMEWQGNQLVTLASGLRWFLRVIDHPVKGKILIGQKRSVGSGFTPGIHILKMQNSRVVEAGILELSHRATVFNFALGDIAGQGETNTVLLSKNDHLFLLDEGGKELWRSSDYFGGSLLYIIDNVPVGRELHFTPRILLTDLDANGQFEVAVCKNLELSRGLMENIRFYQDGELHFLTWDGSILSTAMKTIKFSGAATDYQIKDVDNDGQLELVIISVKEGWRFLGKTGKSTVIILELEELQ